MKYRSPDESGQSLLHDMQNAIGRPTDHPHDHAFARRLARYCARNPVALERLHLRIAKKESVLVGRVAEFHNTGNAAHALQAILMLRVLKPAIDRDLLAQLIDAEKLALALGQLEELADHRGRPVTAADVRAAWERLRRLSSP